MAFPPQLVFRRATHLPESLPELRQRPHRPPQRTDLPGSRSPLPGGPRRARRWRPLWRPLRCLRSPLPGLRRRFRRSASLRRARF